MSKELRGMKLVDCKVKDLFESIVMSDSVKNLIDSLEKEFPGAGLMDNLIKTINVASEVIGDLTFKESALMDPKESFIKSKEFTQKIFAGKEQYQDVVKLFNNMTYEEYLAQTIASKDTFIGTCKTMYKLCGIEFTESDEKSSKYELISKVALAEINVGTFLDNIKVEIDKCLELCKKVPEDCSEVAITEKCNIAYE